MLSENDIKAELSYAYLHAVAARAGFACKPGGRHDDNAAIDAVVSVFRQLSPNSVLTDFGFDLQLKATSSELKPLRDGRRSFALPRHQYDRLRNTETGNQKLLAILELPESSECWLDVREDELVARRCMWWLSLRNAPDVDAATKVTVYIPPDNRLTVEGLTSIATRLSMRKWIDHEFN